MSRGQCVPQPEVIPATDMIMMIGSPAYIVDGYDLTVTCNVTSGTGTPPVNISWYGNGSGVNLMHLSSTCKSTEIILI